MSAHATANRRGTEGISDSERSRSGFNKHAEEKTKLQQKKVKSGWNMGICNKQLRVSLFFFLFVFDILDGSSPTGEG